MPRGEHWAKQRENKFPKRLCQQCGKEIEPRILRRGDGSIHSHWMPKKYCSTKCTGIAAHLQQMTKPRGRFLDKYGYIILTKRKNEKYQQPEHRAVMEQMLGRKLEKHETIHHKNGIRHDNRPENLELWGSRHGRGQRVADTEDIWSGMIPRWALDAHV